MVMVRFWLECWEPARFLAALEMIDLRHVIPNRSAESILSSGVEGLRVNSEKDLTKPQPHMWQMSLT